ncbi:leucine rich adaptor protein 1-like [Phycodurus eques]|uniref:leucine rich adaptor protein 1-like n=1 Tax=Phycodurus eques TaxID=693459 RepID=UPI002ACE45E7|nr:leucine rich adaptor protein 1-like [Phycodurus eques]
MTEETFVGVSFPGLEELENKVGRKAPERLLLWMRDAADSRGGGSEDQNSDVNDCFVDNLKQEMTRMRCADARILRQLVAVHEGIESTRRLASEPSTSAGGRDVSRTGSRSSPVTAEEHERSLSPCRDIPRLTSPVDLPKISSQRSCVEASSRESQTQDLEAGADPTEEVRPGANRPNTEEREETAALLFDYDAHWRWIESRDDVTFL